MELKECEISFICMNSSFDYKEGKLKLAKPFYCEYGDSLPEILNLHLNNGQVWKAKYVRGSFYIEGLAKMMSFYGLKACHLAILQYVGGAEFNLKFYNPYAVEMKLQKYVLVSNFDLGCTVCEEDRLWSTFLYNAWHNFVGLHILHIESKHLVNETYIKVLSSDGCNQLHLTDSVKIIKFGFDRQFWKIRLKWVDGEAYFSKNWCNLVKAANICIGDVVAIYKTCVPFDFKLAIYEKNIISEENFSTEGAVNSSYANFFKVMNSDSLEEAELELPLLFSKNFGQTLSDILHIELGAGYSSKFKYCAATKKIYGLHRFIGKYDIGDDYVLFFNYLGNSKFALSVYDTQSCNHLRDIIGYLRFEDFMYPPSDMEVVVLSDNDEDNDDIQIKSSNSISERDPENEEYLGDEGMFFSVILMKSHVDQQGHGVYIPRFLFDDYQNWGKRTNATLRVGGKQWNIDILRSKNVFRFAKGWDDFTADNSLIVGQRISFLYIGNSTFEVTI